MASRSIAWVNAALALVLILAASLYFAWGSIVRLGADDVRGDFALWLYDSDVAPGDTIDARVRLDSGDRARIRYVAIEGAGKRQVVPGGGDTWGSAITSSSLEPTASAIADFPIAIPGDAPVDQDLHLKIRVDASSAVALGTRFWNDHQAEVFTRDVHVYSQRASVARRIGRLAAALAMCLAVIDVLVSGGRWHARRKLRPSAAWGLMLVPYTFAGYFAFAPLLATAARVHAWWFDAACLVAWFAVLAIPRRLLAGFGLRRYFVSPALVATDGDAAPYRGAKVDAVVKPIVELESAWLGAGLIVERKRRTLSVRLPGADAALVRVPRSEAFGGAPFVIRAADRHTVVTMLDAACRVLGELRCTSDGERGELRFPAR